MSDVICSECRYNKIYNCGMIERTMAQGRAKPACIEDKKVDLWKGWEKGGLRPPNRSYRTSDLSQMLQKDIL